MQHEITNSDQLLDKDGRLKQRGYARRPLLHYNPENVRALRLGPLNRLRLKEWDYYAVTTPQCFFSVTVANIGYIGLVFAYMIDFESLRIDHAQAVTPLGLGCTMPRSSENGDIRFRWPGVSIEMLRKVGRREIKVDWRRFKDNKPLHAELSIEQPEQFESIVMVTPIGERRFYYNQKINCMPTSGELTLGRERIEFQPDQALATLDWGRGVWEYSTFWNWASASGFLSKNTTIGLNLGSGFGDLSAATENCFFINGTMHKLGWVDIEYDNSNYMLPWRFTEADGRLDLTLKPFVDRGENLNLGLLATRTHQMFGRYEGFVIDEAGKKIKVKDLIGWAEEHKARW
ncbi:MAG: DUF2804 domain-containing protein [Candidatus Alcyoniella australis]|nr:DUF2804 domain-containing protein [Candidatus Alcyoniella australis]